MTTPSYGKSEHLGSTYEIFRITYNDEHPLVSEQRGACDVRNSIEEELQCQPISNGRGIATYTRRSTNCTICTIPESNASYLFLTLPPRRGDQDNYRIKVNTEDPFMFRISDSQPGFRQLSKTPRKKRPVARVAKFVADPVAARVAPKVLSMLLRWITSERTPKDEIDCNVLSGRILLHENVGRILSDCRDISKGIRQQGILLLTQISDIEDTDQGAEVRPLEFRFTNDAIGGSRGQTLSSYQHHLRRDLWRRPTFLSTN